MSLPARWVRLRLSLTCQPQLMPVQCSPRYHCYYNCYYNCYCNDDCSRPCGPTLSFSSFSGMPPLHAMTGAREREKKVDGQQDTKEARTGIPTGVQLHFRASFSVISTAFKPGLKLIPAGSRYVSPRPRAIATSVSSHLGNSCLSPALLFHLSVLQTVVAAAVVNL